MMTERQSRPVRLFVILVEALLLAGLVVFLGEYFGLFSVREAGGHVVRAAL
jgi:hypothetical protein